MFDAFLSYSRHNEAFAVRIRAALDAAGKTLWLDKRDIQPAEDWRTAAFTGIDSAHNFLFVITPDSVQNKPDGSLAPCGEELARAVASGKRLIPIHYLQTPHSTVAKDLRDLNDVDFRNTDDDPAAFAHAVDTLLTAMNTDLAWVAQHTLLQVRASDWQARGKDPSALLRGDLLKNAESWQLQPLSPDQRIKPTPLQAEYIAASRSAETRSQKLRTRIAASVAAFSLVLAVIALVMFFRARREARIATAGRLAATALTFRDTQLDLAALLSVEAVRRVHTFETRNAQLILFQSTPNLLTYLHLDNPDDQDFNSVQSIAFRPDGTQFATAGGYGTLELWDTATLQSIWKSVQPGRLPEKLEFSPDGKLLAVLYLGDHADAGGEVELWDTSSAQPHRLVANLDGVPGQPTSLAFDRTGNLLAVSGQGGVQVWFVPQRLPLRKLGPASVYAWSVAFSPLDPTLLAFTTDKTLYFQNAVTSAPRGDVAYKDDPASTIPTEERRFGHLVFSRDGTHMAVADAEQRISLYKITASPTRANASLQTLLPVGDDGTIMALTYSPDGRRLVVASSHGAMREWSVPTLKVLRDYPPSLAVTHYSAAYGPRGLLLSGLKSGIILVWDEANSGTQQITLPGLTFAGFTADSKSLVFKDAAGRTSLWDIARQSLAPAVSPPASANAIDSFAIIHGETIELHRRGQITPFNPHLNAVPDKAVVSPSGNYAAATTAYAADHPDPSIRSRMLWDLRSGQPRPIPLRGPDYGTFGLVFNPAETLLATTGFKGVFLWNTKDGTHFAAETEENRKPILNAAFNPDGKSLAVYVDDGQVSLLDLATLDLFGLPLQPDLHAYDSKHLIAFSPDGKLLAFEGPAHSLVLWNADPQAWADRACRLANRNLTLREWRRYIGSAVPYHQTCPDSPAPR